MRAPILALLAGALALGAGVAARWPARSLATALPEGIACTRLGGTIWTGHCAGLSAGGRLLGNLRWQIRPAALLLGRISAAVRLDSAGGPVAAELTAFLGGRIEARQLVANLDLRRAPLPGLPADLGGRLVADLPSISWSGSGLERVAGRIEAQGLARGSGNGPPLGSFEVTFDPPAQGKPPTARIQDLGGPLWLRSTLAWVPPRGYLLEGEVQARAGAPDTLRRDLERLGPADAQGRRRFAQEASL